MKKLKWILIVFIGIALLMKFIAMPYMQKQTKKHSPEQTANYHKNNKDLKVIYSSPSKKGRVLFGELIPYNHVWRTGANEPTSFITETDIKIVDKNLPAGIYSLWTIPNKEKWNVIFIMAASSREARDMLRSRALTPIDLNRSRRKTAKTTEASQNVLSGRVKLKDLTRATRQLAILIKAATPVEDALRVIALQFEKSPMRAVLLSIRGQVMEGLKLSDAMRSQPQAFDDLYVAMVASGESSARLAEVLERQADDLEAAQAIRRKILGATVYPIVLSGVAILVVAILMIFVVPKVVDQFDSFGQDLPALTKFVIGFSAGFKAYGIWVGISLILLFIGLKFLLSKTGPRYKWDGIKLKLPVLGSITRDLNAARFARTMAGLISAGTPALAALETSRHTLKNSVMRKSVIGAATRVREGEPLSKALQKTNVFPPLVTQMVAGGEASGDTGEMFARSADYLENEFDAKTSVFLTLLEPLIIIGLAMIVLVIIAAIFLPILTLNTLIL